MDQISLIFFFNFEKNLENVHVFFFQNQISKFQNQYFSMRFFLNLIYASSVFQRARSQLPTPKLKLKLNCSNRFVPFFLSKCNIGAGLGVHFPYPPEVFRDLTALQSGPARE